MNHTEAQHNAIKTLLATLREVAAEVRRLETIAHSFLYEKGDQQAYHDQLRQKAIILSELAEKVLLPDLPPQLNTQIQERVGSFSFEADRALKLDSVFYMAVLLYPEDYQDGMPNELDNLIDQLLLC